MLLSSPVPLTQAYDLAMFDLDGVIYVGGHSIEGVPAELQAVRSGGLPVAFVTNNASRTPESVAKSLTRMGIPASREDIVTSAQAAARVLRDRFGTGAHIVFLGAAGLESALIAEDLVPVAVSDTDAVALCTGYGPDVLWRDIMRAAVRVREGLPWVASNTDMSIPTDFGIAPGHGVLVDMLSRFAGVVPQVAGKPERPLLDETIRRVGGSRPLMVGDRLDTDIEGAHNVGVDSLLVLTGVSGLHDLASALPHQRPTYISPGLEGLSVPHPAPEVLPDTGPGVQVELGGWVGRVDDGDLVVQGAGSLGDWWRVAAVAAWTHRDLAGVTASVERAKPPVPRRAGESL